MIDALISIAAIILLQLLMGMALGKFFKFGGTS